MSTEDVLLEGFAKAIYKSRYGQPPFDKWKNVHEGVREILLTEARAALKYAMEHCTAIVARADSEAK